jgi:hypothetical protein
MRRALPEDFDAGLAGSCPLGKWARRTLWRVTTSAPRRPRTWQRARTTSLTAIAMSLMVGCGGGGQAAEAPTAAPAATAAPASPGDIDPALLEPLTMLGPCTVEPNAIDEEPVDGALLPDGAVLTSQTAQGPLTQIKGYIPMTPVQIRVFYQRQDTFEVLQVEDEVRESEVLLADGNHRLFVKAQAICELGSVFLAVVAPESSGNQVPLPAGGG